jgi:hypothetical protein
MLIGIGFLTLVIGAIAQRFLVPSVEESELALLDATSSASLGF